MICLWREMFITPPPCLSYVYRSFLRAEALSLQLARYQAFCVALGDPFSKSFSRGQHCSFAACLWQRLSFGLISISCEICNRHCVCVEEIFSVTIAFWLRCLSLLRLRFLLGAPSLLRSCASSVVFTLFACPHLHWGLDEQLCERLHV